jgi:hypothetical protein
MTKFFAIYIHNISVCYMEEVESLEDGISKIKGEALEALGELSDEQMDDADNIYEIMDLSDGDHHHSWLSHGAVERKESAIAA